jgi:hypothetical protein
MMKEPLTVTIARGGTSFIHVHITDSDPDRERWYVLEPGQREVTARFTAPEQYRNEREFYIPVPVDADVPLIVSLVLQGFDLYQKQWALDLL